MIVTGMIVGIMLAYWVVPKFGAYLIVRNVERATAHEMKGN